MIALKLFRNMKNISLQEMADILGITKQSINQWEKGTRPIPKKRLEELGDVFDIPFNLLSIEVDEDAIKYLQNQLIKFVLKKQINELENEFVLKKQLIERALKK
jgi:transcriptional regulator with XRE-family HTH domain